MVQLQSGGYGSSYFHKIWVEYYCLGENQASETFCSKCFRCQSSCQLQNHKILSTHRGLKNAFGQNFWNLIFFFNPKRQSYRYYQEKKSRWAHIIFIHKSYIETVDKIGNSPKKQVKVLHFLGSCISVLLQIGSSFRAS